MGNNLLGRQTPGLYNPKHLSPLSTNGSTTTGHHRTSSLMSLNPLAAAFLPSCQSSSNPPISLSNSTTKGLPLAQLLCGMPSQTLPSLAPTIHQYNSDNTLLLPLLQQTNQSKWDTAARQPTLGSSAPLPSSLQHQSNCLQAINKTINQFNQQLKAEHLDRQTLQLLVLQLQSDFALLRYLLFSYKNIATKDSATSPLLHPHPNATPPSSAFPLSGPSERKLLRSTPVGAVGPPRTKSNNTANADFQPTSNTQEALPTTVQNLTSRICKLEKLFADEVSAYTSITAGIHSQYFFLYEKLRQLEPGHSDVNIWKIPSVKFVFDSAKVATTIIRPPHRASHKFLQPHFQESPPWLQFLH